MRGRKQSSQLLSFLNCHILKKSLSRHITSFSQLLCRSSFIKYLEAYRSSSWKGLPTSDDDDDDDTDDDDDDRDDGDENDELKSCPKKLSISLVNSSILNPPFTS